jgi:HNH endonuclease
MTLEALIERDGASCVLCGRAPWRTDLTAEHLVPRSRGGRTSPENLTIACRSCNKRRGTKPVVAYVRSLLQEGGCPQGEALLVCLTRLTSSDRRDLAAYGTRQLALLERLLDERSGAPRRRSSDVAV